MLSNLDLMKLINVDTDWLNHRNRIIANNVANANTPRYIAKDLKPIDFKNLLQSMHDSNFGNNNQFSFRELKDYSGEMSIDGNNVALEEQVAKLSNDKTKYSFDLKLMKAYYRMLKMSHKD